MITAILSGVSILSIIVVTYVLILKQKELNVDYNNKIKKVVTQVNDVHSAGYSALQLQEFELANAQKKIKLIRNNYVTNDALNNNVDTESINIGKYEISKNPTNNNLNINMPPGKKSGISIVNGENTNFSMDGETGQVMMNGNLDLNGNTKVNGYMNIKGDTELRGNTNNIGDLNVGKNTNIKGNMSVNGNITTPHGHTIRSAGRQHIAPGEILYLLPKKGVSLTKNWGASGDLRVGGTTELNGPVNIKGGKSEHNPKNWKTHFPWSGDSKNYIRGDTELRGNTNNIGDLNVGRNTNIKGNMSVNGNITTPNNHTINNPGRQHIAAGEILYLLPKSGVRIGKEWGGTGNLQVQGDLTVKGSTNISTLCIDGICLNKNELINLKKMSQ